jgi:hypothetical protein
VRFIVRNPVARALAAAATSALLTAGVWWAGVIALVATLFGTLLIIAFAALTIVPDAIAHQRRHPWRWWWRSSDDEGPFWPGTHIPRHPGRPRR